METSAVEATAETTKNNSYQAKIDTHTPHQHVEGANIANGTNLR